MTTPEHIESVGNIVREINPLGILLLVFLLLGSIIILILRHQIEKDKNIDIFLKEDVKIKLNSIENKIDTIHSNFLKKIRK